jgi:hypothetical protein
MEPAWKSDFAGTLNNSVAVLFSWLFLTLTEDAIRKERSAVPGLSTARKLLKEMRLCVRAPQLGQVHRNLLLVLLPPRKKTSRKYGR